MAETIVRLEIRGPAPRADEAGRLCARQADAATCRGWWAEGTRLALPEAVRLALNAGQG